MPPGETEERFQIHGPNFMAVVLVVSGRVIQAAPVVAEFKGKRWSEVERRCRHEGWTVNRITISIQRRGPKPKDGTTPPA